MSAESTNYTPLTPHGELKKVFDNIYVVDGSFDLGFGILIGRTMTIYKQGDDLTIINSVRVSEAVEEEIKKLGTVKTLVRMCGSHGTDDQYYIDKFKPTYWSMDILGTTPNGGKPSFDKTLKEDDLPLPGMKMAAIKSGMEVIFWVPDNGGTLISADIIQNTNTISPYSSWVGEKMTYWMGFMGECRCVPLWKLTHGTDHKEIVETILSWDFENLLPAHGEVKTGGAKLVCEQNLKAMVGMSE